LRTPRPTTRPPRIGATPRSNVNLELGQLFQVWALDGQVVAAPVKPLVDAFGMFPGLDTSDPRDHEDRL